MDHQDYFSVTEAAKFLGVSHARIYRLCKDGVIQCIRMGKFFFPTKESVQRYKEDPKRQKFSPKTGTKVPRYARMSSVDSGDPKAN